MTSNVIHLNENPAAKDVLDEIQKNSAQIQDIVAMVFYKNGESCLLHSACDFSQLSVAAHCIEHQLFSEAEE